MELILQITILVLAILYKYFLSKGKAIGWPFSATASAVSIIYLWLYFFRPILITLEGTFFLISLYGWHKHMTDHKNKFTVVDMVLICFALVISSYLTYKQIQVKTIWYEIGATVFFLIGNAFLAQRKTELKKLGWILFIIASICMTIVMLIKKEPSYILALVQLVSIIICIFALKRIVKSHP